MLIHTSPPVNLPTDPHSYASTSPVRPRHLALDLTVDFAGCTLAGIVTASP